MIRVTATALPSNSSSRTPDGAAELDANAGGEGEADLDALITLAVWLLGPLFVSASGLGLLCLLTALYGVGSGWPLIVPALLLAACTGLWLRSLRGAWRNAGGGQTEKPSRPLPASLSPKIPGEPS